MSEATFRSDMTVELVEHMASDASVVQAARVSTAGSSVEWVNPVSERDAGLINYLMRERHGSPFEHNAFTFYVEAPIFVYREWHRHRVGFSYNEESGRYKTLEPVFYVPGPERNLQQVGKPGHYTFLPGTPAQQSDVAIEGRRVANIAYNAYLRMLESGVAREVARTVLPVSIYSSQYVTLNARSLMSFLSLRTFREDATFVSHPQREIEMCAEQMEVTFAELMPVTWRAFVDNGRVAP